MSYKKSFKSQRPSHGHSKNMFAEVRRKPHQKSFSLKINTPFLNTSNGGTDVCGGSSGNVSATSATCRFRLFPLVVFFRKKFSRTESCAEDINSFWISSILFWLQSYKIFCRCASVNRHSRTSTAETNCTTYYALFCLFCTTKCAFLAFFAQLNVHF